jgi:hypothetical protein
MPLLLLLIAVLLVVYFVLAQRQPRADDEGLPEDTSRLPDFAFIGQGRLYCKTPADAPVEVQSPFSQNVLDRQERSRELHSWKEGTAFNMNFARGGEPMDSEGRLFAVGSAVFLAPDRVLYFLHDNKGGGLFQQTLSTAQESRLLHRHGLQLEGFCLSLDKSKLYASARSSKGAASLVVVNVDGTDYRELTAGDTLDAMPAPMPHEDNQLVYQSQGVARNEHGSVIAYGPSSIQLLELGKNRVTSVLDNAEFDYLNPRVDSQGNLLYLRRPYEGQRYGRQDVIKDTVLFPFRLLRAVFHFLNTFSMMFSSKPLTSASGPELRGDLRKMVLKGKQIDAEAALRSTPATRGVPSLVPLTWELRSLDKGGQDRLIARQVASFDVLADGSLLFSNGFGVFHQRRGFKARTLYAKQYVSDVFAIQ